MRTLGASHVGRVRTSNQDAFICGSLSEKASFAVVCDGMGGANGGNVASSIAVRMVADRLVDDYRDVMDGKAIHALFAQAIDEANEAVFNVSMENMDLRGMGTTVVAAIATEQRVSVAYVGDSRAYIVTHDAIEQITSDHSVVQEMVEQGKITPEQAKTHPKKHFLTRAVGVESETQCGFVTVPFPEQGTLLLCTDGLSNMVETDTLQSLIRTFPFEEIPNKLINTANLAGGSDNITVVALVGNEKM